MKSDGQTWALNQLREIAAKSGQVFELVEIEEPSSSGKLLRIMLSVNLEGYDRGAGGIPFRIRERLKLDVPPGFPLERPSLYFTHKLYGDFAHVQWGNSICLYQAPNTEWQPADGMFGFIGRVDDWLRAAALGQLDPAGQPLHPPAVYPQNWISVIPTQDTPKPEASFWHGYAEITRENDVCVELGRWIAGDEQIPEARLAVTILLASGMPHEYPTTLLDLLTSLIDRGVTPEFIRLVLSIGALRTPPGKPMFFVLGAAMRGISEGARMQHLAAWHVDGERADALRNAALEATPENPINIEVFYRWAVDAKVEWCRVLEDRPEIVERRDSQAASAVWSGKHVALLGCGAIGSALALMLVRSGVQKLQVYDKSLVTPGILVRQQFNRRQIGYGKASALSINAQAVNPDVDLSYVQKDILAVLKDEQSRAELLAADVIVDATASTTVAVAMEALFRNSDTRRPPLFTMALGHNADCAMMTMAAHPSVGMSIDLDRRTKLALANSARGRTVLDEFWPTDAKRRQLFRPEPGCSDPTFRGSAADVQGLVARMANVAGKWLADAGSPTRSYAIDFSNLAPAAGYPKELEFAWEADSLLIDSRHGFQIRLSKTARSALLSWMRRSERVNGPRTETGGILFGHAEDFLKILWIDEVSGPPADSLCSPVTFICGTAGVAEMNSEKMDRSRGSTHFIGMWHTHPLSVPNPSKTDLEAMAKLLSGADDAFLGRRFLMLIIGGTADNPNMGGTVFERNDF